MCRKYIGIYNWLTLLRDVRMQNKLNSQRVLIDNLEQLVSHNFGLGVAYASQSVQQNHYG